MPKGPKRSGAKPPAPSKKVGKNEIIFEDDPRWNWPTMGNRRGPGGIVRYPGGKRRGPR